MRLFFAIDTPAAVRAEMGRIRDHLREARADARWESDEKLHCTMKFLGETPEALLEPIVTAVSGVAGSAHPFRIVYRGLGCFPDIRRPRVVWVGIDDFERVLVPLAAEVDRACAEFGFQPEERAFHPHVTLGRIRSLVSLHDLLSRIESVTFESPTVTIGEISLIKSNLRPTGSVYTTVRSFPLGGSGGEYNDGFGKTGAPL